MKTIYTITGYNQDGRAVNVIELTEEEYAEIERAMQWPEDLAEYDRLNTPVRATLEGWII
jgi:hypothetical protein